MKWNLLFLPRNQSISSFWTGFSFNPDHQEAQNVLFNHNNYVTLEFNIFT